MGKVLQQAVRELTKLPEAEQEAAGAWILSELESERRWDDLFARSADLLEEMAAEAIREALQVRSSDETDHVGAGGRGLPRRRYST